MFISLLFNSLTFVSLHLISIEITLAQKHGINYDYNNDYYTIINNMTSAQMLKINEIEKFQLRA